MKSLGIAVITLILGVVGALWWHSSQGNQHSASDLDLVTPNPPPADVSAIMRDELVTAVSIMEARIAELERQLARERKEKEAAEVVELPEPAEDAELEMAEGETEGEPAVDLVNAPFQLDFDTPLEPYGEWWDTPDYGRVWQPDIGAAGGDWAPYTDGGWEYTDAGFGFVSEEPWGWATYHYGRWANLDPLGWCWVPGYDWAPSWVSWRVGSGHIGWAPLPPSARCGRGGRIGKWVDTLCDIGPSLYCFVPVSQFGRGNCAPCIVDCRRDIELFLGSRNVTNIHHRGGRFAVCCFGPDLDWISHQGGRGFERLALAASLGHGQRGCWVDGSGRRLNVRLANEVLERGSGSRPPARVADKVRHQRGWAEIEGGEVESKVRRHLLAEAKGVVPKVSAMAGPKVTAEPKRLNVSTPMFADGVEDARVVTPKAPTEVVSPVRDAQKELADAAERRRLELAAAVERANQQRVDAIRQLQHERLVAEAKRNGRVPPKPPSISPPVVANPEPAPAVLDVTPPRREVAVNNQPKVDNRRQQQVAAQQRAFAEQQQRERDEAARRSQQRKIADQRAADVRRQQQVAAQQAEAARRQQLAAQQAEDARRQQIAAQRADAARQQKAAADAARRRAAAADAQRRADAQRQAAARQAAARQAAAKSRPTPAPAPRRVSPPVAPSRPQVAPSRTYPGKR